MVSVKRRIYTLTGLPPEVVAVAFAKCSRSPEQFDKIAQELNEDKSRKFHEKWIVGYGHSSIAEHAVLSLAIEGVSMLASKVIEDNRLASYTEKSSRYQVFDRNTYYKPKKLLDSPLGKLYVETLDFIMDSYTAMIPAMLEFFRKKNPQKKDVSDALYNMRIKNMACDSCRYLLPVSTLTNLAMTVNARQLENAINKLLTHPLQEMNEIGQEIRSAALKVTPTLVKYTGYNEYLGKTSEHLKALADDTLKGDIEKTGSVMLVGYDPDADNKLVAALLYRFSHHPYAQIMEKVKKMRSEEKESIVDEGLKRLGKFDRPLREVEHVNYTFDILIDYGAFRDIQRHRIATQTNQECTVMHGYSIPESIISAGLEKKYRECMEKAKDAFYRISKEFPAEAQYIVPFAYRKRVLFTWNLRELFHFIRLRTGKTAHISYKRVAQQIYELIRKKQPLMAKYITCNYD